MRIYYKPEAGCKHRHTEYAAAQKCAKGGRVVMITEHQGRVIDRVLIAASCGGAR